MEFKYREDSLPGMKRKMYSRGALFLVISVAFLCTYAIPLPWYLSLLPGLIVLLFSLGDLFGTSKMERYRKSMTISLNDRGIYINIYGVKNPIFWSWEQISVIKENDRNGILSSFVIGTGDKYTKSWEFTDDIDGFSSLYKQVSNRGRA